MESEFYEGKFRVGTKFKKFLLVIKISGKTTSDL